MRDYRDVSRIVGAKESWSGPTAGRHTHRSEGSAKGRHGIWWEPKTGATRILINTQVQVEPCKSNSWATIKAKSAGFVCIWSRTFRQVGLCLRAQGRNSISPKGLPGAGICHSTFACKSSGSGMAGYSSLTPWYLPCNSLHKVQNKRKWIMLLTNKRRVIRLVLQWAAMYGDILQEDDVWPWLSLEVCGDHPFQECVFVLQYRTTHRHGSFPRECKCKF